MEIGFTTSFIIKRLAILLVMATVIAARNSRGLPEAFVRVVARSSSVRTTTRSFSKPNSKPTSSKSPNLQRLVLVGGGHAHVQVIKALNHASRPKNLHVTLIDVQESASYSGMVPGCISGSYRPEETLLHLRPLTDWAGIEFIHDKVVDIDIDGKKIWLRGDNDDHSSFEPIPFDAISIDIGSASRGLREIKGSAKFTIPTRPISDLVRRLGEATDELVKQLKEKPNSDSTPVADVVVIGGGTAGVELAMNVMGRWNPLLGADGRNRVRVTVLNAGSELLPGEALANREKLEQILEEQGIQTRHGCTVREVREHSVCLENGEEIPFTHCLWATGAGAHQLPFQMQKRGLAVSKHGWIRVNKHLQSVSHPHIFSAGDCCTIEGLSSGSPPKAGVYAVRSGPVLIENLTRFLSSCREPRSKADLKEYHPQDDFLKLIVCGDGTALGFRFGFPMHGKWVFQMKDAIDQGFMNLFRSDYLPELKEGQPYDTSQYDATNNGDRPPRLDPVEAAELVQRSDDDVDFQAAWQVLKDMTQDEEYREQVLQHVTVAQEEFALS